MTARQIVREIQLINEDLAERQRDFRKSCDEREALVRWANLCGPAAMDEYLFRLVCDEVRLQSLENVRNWQIMLCRLIEFMLFNGMPMEGLSPRPNFQEEMRQARNAGKALLAVLNACARVTQTISEIDWPSHKAFGTWISSLQGFGIETDKRIALKCLSFLDLKNCVLSGQNLYGANLYKTDLSFADLEGANLKGANLAKSKLCNANLTDTNLRNVNLNQTNIQGANLDKAYFYNYREDAISCPDREDDLEERFLREANLKEIDLHGINLERSDLSGADLYRANLDRALLYGATLRRADLRDADLQGANLEGANLEGANLRGTILENDEP